VIPVKRIKAALRSGSRDGYLPRSTSVPMYPSSNPRVSRTSPTRTRAPRLPCPASRSSWIRWQLKQTFPAPNSLAASAPARHWPSFSDS